jgi:serine/threonine protein kinase
MRELQHPNVLKLLDVVSTEDYFCIVLEYSAGGDFFDLISKEEKVRFKIDNRYIAN